jgi:membrane protease YdiL (CAAX protease family)
MLSAVLLMLARLLMPGYNLNQAQDIGFTSISGYMYVTGFIALAVLPPVSEELIFRGFLFSRLRGHKLNMYLATLITSSLFGLVHGQLNVAIDTFALSLVLIFISQKQQSIVPAIILHSLKNTVAFLALFVFHVRS